ncbi:MAG: hypothetical protein KF753_22200 [Caldilineaceae bacterium]|nr:hypothetical protein [Caldilineaceae bacterium]
MQPKRQSPFDAPRIVGYVPDDKAAHIGAATPIPILDIPLADQRQWCKAALDWLDGETPRHGCPTADMCADGSCRRSPSKGRCLLLLPGDHPDWKQARGYRFDVAVNAITPRNHRTAPSTRTPLRLEQMNPPLVTDPLLDEWQRRQQRINTELEKLRGQGFAIAVDAAAVIGAELRGGSIDLETGEIEY